MIPIDKEAAIEAIKEMAMRPTIQCNADTVNGLLGAMNIIYDLPTAEKVGKWILKKVCEDEYGNGKFQYFCSECGASAYEFFQPYCHKCGARMEVQE